MTKKGWRNRLQDQILGWDIFGEPVAFNFAGKDTIRSYLGAIFSLVLTVLLCLYGYQMALILIFKKNPDIVEAKIPDYYPDQFKFDFDSLNFPFAFGVFAFKGATPKNDENYVQWQATINIETIEGTRIEPLKYHVCTDEDYEEFMAPSEKSAAQVEKIKAQKAMYCLDKGQSIEMNGTPSSTLNNYIEFTLLPCQNSTTKTCDKTLEEVEDYLGVCYLAMLTNYESFSPDGYGDESIIRESRLNKQQMSAKPHYFEYFIRHYEYQDQSSYLQLGLTFEQYYKQMYFSPYSQSSWTQYPERYKFVGFDIWVDTTVYTVQRSTYHVLQYVGDIGGLLQGLMWIGQALVGWYTSRYRQRFMISNLFQFTDFGFKKRFKKQVDEYGPQFVHKKDQIGKTIINDFKNRNQIAPYSLMTSIKNSLVPTKQTRFFYKFAKKCESKIDEELDVVNLITALRTFNVQISAIMSRNQIDFSRKLAQQLLQEGRQSSTDSSQKDSEVDEPNTDFKDKQFQEQISSKQPLRWQELPSLNEKLPNLKKLIQSTDKIDVNLLNLYKINNANRVFNWNVKVDPMLENFEQNEWSTKQQEFYNSPEFNKNTMNVDKTLKRGMSNSTAFINATNQNYSQNKISNLEQFRGENQHSQSHNKIFKKKQIVELQDNMSVNQFQNQNTRKSYIIQKDQEKQHEQFVNKIVEQEYEYQNSKILDELFQDDQVNVGFDEQMVHNHDTKLNKFDQKNNLKNVQDIYANQQDQREAIDQIDSDYIDKGKIQKNQDK